MRFPKYLRVHIENEVDWERVGETICGQINKIEHQKKDAEKKSMTLIIISGLSGAGKDSIVNSLINKDDRFGWIRTCTTRTRRPEENDQNDTYIRISENEFQKALSGGDVVEWVEYAGNHYCSLTSVFLKALEDYKYPILRIDPKGSRFYVDLWENNKWLFDKVNLIYFFIVPPTIDSLKERLLQRSGDLAFVEKRLSQTLLDLPFINVAEYVVINETGKLETAVEDIAKIVL